MANIARSDPFNSLDEIFRGLLVRPVRFDLEGMQQNIKLDVSKSDGGYIVKAEVPGVNKDDINISIDRNEVTITAEVKREVEDKKGEEVIRRERFQGTMVRSFTLPQEIDESKASAKYENGVLELTLPIKNKASTKKLAIN